MSKKIISIISTIALLVCCICFIPITSHAELNASEMEMTIPQGGTHSIGIGRDGTIGCYLVGNTSSYTYIVEPDRDPNQSLTIHVGLDEQSATLHIYIFTSYNNESLDIIVNVDRIYGTTYVKSQNTTTTTASANPQNALLPVVYTNGTTGTLQLLDGNKRGLFYSTEGTPIASFSVKDKNGNALVLSVGAQLVYVNGMYYLTVNTPVGGRVYMTTTDAEAIRTYGVYGLYLNGGYTGWEG